MSQIKLIPFAEEETAKMIKLYSTFRDNGLRFVRTNPGSCVLPTAYEKIKERIKNFQLREDDIFVFAFAKNGTTWSQELTWCVQNGCDLERARSVPVIARVPFLESPCLMEHMPREAVGVPEDAPADLFSMMENFPSPRMLKSHLPFCLLPDDLLDKNKVVLCVRNPKDTVVSFYHHEQLIKMHSYEGDFPTYFDMFMNNQVLYSPYFDYIKEAWKRRDHPNLCLLFFEDMKKDQESAIRKVAKFLGKELSDEQVAALVEHLSFNKMKENITASATPEMKNVFHEGKGHFFRKGKAGDWTNYFTEEMNKRMDEAIEKHFKPIGLEFTYGL
eukprot:Seg6375.1 transcript_id=Seg6375.1/GoldUCD/mRNA.D3Y31 product="Sulfotransferase 1C4" protein_id=Seg6375.1/GoldUCD/D3Y31